MTVDPTPFTPFPKDVHAYLAAYPEFTGTSKPTADEVQTIADQIAGDLVAELTVQPSEQLNGLALLAVTLGTAAYVAQSWWPEQQAGDNSLGQQLYGRYLNALSRLRQLLDGTSADTAGDAGSIATPSATLLAARSLYAGVVPDWTRP